MSIHYCTKEGDNLDWICWYYYIHEVSLSRAAMSVDPRLLSTDLSSETNFLFNSHTDEALRGVVETVLQSNPGLAFYPLSLPAGVNIFLPDVNSKIVENDSVRLWD